MTEIKIKIRRWFTKNQSSIQKWIAIYLVLSMLAVTVNIVFTYLKLDRLEKEHDELVVDYEQYKDSTKIKFEEAYQMYEAELVENEVLTAQLDSCNTSEKEVKTVDPLVSNGILKVSNGMKYLDMKKLARYTNNKRIYWGAEHKLFKHVKMKYFYNEAVGTY